MTSPRGEELTTRQQQVLRTIVKEYIDTDRPVGSETIREKHGLQVSSATIRNEMARLTEQGYLTQPHTSAGRVPTEKAYRLHIRGLAGQSLSPVPEASWIRGQYRRMGTDPDSILRATTRMLAQLTQRPALTISRASERPPTFTEIHATPISAHAVRLSYTCSDGSCQELVVKSSQALTAEQIRQLDRALAEELAETPATDVGRLETLAGQRSVPVPPALLQSIAASLVGSWRGRVYVDGTAYILRYPEFQEQERLRGLMEVLDEEDAVHRLLHAVNKRSQVTVIIGLEHCDPALADCSLVGKGFGHPTAHQSPRGTLGVLGPMRTRYEQIMSAVSCVADHTTEVLSQRAAADQRN